MIYAPDGITHARQDAIPLQGRHAKWLIDGGSFLTHLDDLLQIRIEARCTTCGERCRATPAVESGRCAVRCGCRAGSVDVARPLVVEALLLSLGWTLVCTACEERIHGDNDPQAAEFTVTCPCTVRAYRLAVA